ncbi:MAG: sigma-70 family RNA polymerase sigma factor, partial [Verrucomicrobiota bacterium]
MMDDWTLLTAWVEGGDQAAFAALVERHIGLVFGVAVRKLGNPAAAEEVVQSVFSELARKAGTLHQGCSLSSWLYQVACGKAVDHIRTESARRRRESLYAEDTMQDSDDNEKAAAWREIAPLLEEAMAELCEEDRTAVLMRVFEKRPLREVGQTLGVTDDTARKQVNRTLDQLRLWLQRRGVSCTASALGALLGTATIVHPASTVVQSTISSALASASSSAALSGTATTTSITATSILSTMASIKLPIFLGLVAGAAFPVSFGFFDRAPSTAPSTPASVEGSAPDLSLPAPAASGLMAEWEALREIHGPSAGTMPRFYEVVSKIEDAFKRRIFRTALLAEWVTVDPGGALTYFEKEDNGSRIEDLLRIWLRQDPTSAIAAMKAGGKPVENQIGDLLEDIARIRPAELADLATGVRAKNVWDSRVEDAFAQAAMKDLTGMRNEALAIEGSARKDALAGVARLWAEREPEAALTWARELEPSEDRALVLQKLLVGWAKRDPVAALDHLGEAPPGGGQQGYLNTETAEQVLKSAAGAN